jgi:glutathione reductase (NADPH)
MKAYDLVVIGGGSGGVRAARIAASHGASTLVVEESRIGGTCVIRGCVPKKLLVYASRIGMEFEDGRGFGWSYEERAFSWGTLMGNVANELTRLERAYESTLRSAGVHIAYSRAELLGAGRVRLCADGQVILAKHILIATGARPVADESLPGWQFCATSDDVFQWNFQPRRVLVQGAGYIALELACLLARLGSEVTVVCRGSHILRGFDEDLRLSLQAELSTAGIKFVTQQTLASVTRVNDELGVELSDGSPVGVDAVIRAVGRRPNVQGLGLEAASVRTDDRGAIVVDEMFQSSAPGIYAVGDVTNSIHLTPVAIRDGHAFAQAIFGAGPRPSGLSLVPTAVFTTPELGTVGLSEAQAVQQFGQVNVYVAQFRAMKSVLSGRAGKCFFKLVVHGADGRLLGAHLIAPEAAEMIQLLGAAISAGARKADLDATLPLHPTLAEELVTMRSPTRRHGMSEAD